MGRRLLPQRRPRVGPLGRAASYLLAFALFAQGVVGAGAALGMWFEARDTMARGHCAAPQVSGTEDQSSDHASYAHDHCLLCNSAAADRPAPVLPLLSAAFEGAVVPPAAPAIVAYRKVVYANAARAPPPSA